MGSGSGVRPRNRIPRFAGRRAFLPGPSAKSAFPGGLKRGARHRIRNPSPSGTSSPCVAERLPGCFRNPRTNPIRGRCAVVVPPVAHPIIGCRRLRDTDACRNDGTVGRIAGPKRSPDVSAVGPRLTGVDGRGVAEVRSELDNPVMGHMAREGFSGAAPDYCGPVSGTGCHAGGTAADSNGKREGVHGRHPSSAPSPGPTGSPTSLIVPETSETPVGPTSPSTAVRAEHADAFRTKAGTRIDGTFPNKPSPDDRIR